MRSSAFERKRKKKSSKEQNPRQALLLHNKIMASEFRSHTLDAFMDMMTQFIQACRGVWPECAGLRAMALGFDMMTGTPNKKEEFIQDYYSSLEPFFSRCTERDPTLFTEESIPFLSAVQMREKWLDNSVDEETRSIIFDYILELNKLSQMHVGIFSRIPDTTLDRIQQMAQTIAERIQSGEMSPTDLSPAMLTEIGQDVVDGLSEEEMRAFTDNILRDPTALTQLASNLTGGMNPADLASAFMGGAGGGGDMLSMAMQMMQQQQGPAPSE